MTIMLAYVNLLILISAFSIGKAIPLQDDHPLSPVEDEIANNPHFPGFDGIDSYIVGGENVALGELPYQISLRNGRNHSCGGSIINKDWVVTAAHCVTVDPTNRRVWAGTISSAKIGSTGVIVGIEKIIIHPKYRIRTKPFFIVNDVALLKLKKSLHFTNNIRPVRLPSARHRATGDALVSGWGRTKVEPRTPILQKITLNLITDKKCREVYKDMNITIPESHLCGGDSMGKKAQCHGDSGGPWVIPGTRTLIGIVSWGPGRECTSPKYPGVAMEAAFFVDWINQVIAAH